MVYILYKIHNDNVLFTGAYDIEKDALDIQKNMSYEDNHFVIADLPHYKYEPKPVVRYIEEDNNLDEEDYDRLKEIIRNLTKEVNKYKNIINVLLTMLCAYILIS